MTGVQTCALPISSGPQVYGRAPGLPLGRVYDSGGCIWTPGLCLGPAYDWGRFMFEPQIYGRARGLPLGRVYDSAVLLRLSTFRMSLVIFLMACRASSLCLPTP